MTTKTEEGAGFYRADEEVEEVVRKFESGEFTPDEFDHGPHLTVALVYLLRLPDEEALGRLRQSIRRFLARHELDPLIYHETLTRFWLKRVRAFVGRAGAGRPLHQVANELLEACGDSRLVYEYYSRERIDTREARAGWVGPDLRPLEF